MAHQSHPEDTMFIIAEPDFVFTSGDGDIHSAWMSEEQQSTCHFVTLQ